MNSKADPQPGPALGLLRADQRAPMAARPTSFPSPLPEKGIGPPTFIIPASGKDNRPCPQSLLPRRRRHAPALSICWRRMASPCTRPTNTGRDCCKRKRPTSRLASAWPIESTPKLVARGGFGLFFNSFENQGYGPNIGENYPFVFNLSYPACTPSRPLRSQVAPLSYNSPFNDCDTARSAAGTAILRVRVLLHPAYAKAVNAQGLGFRDSSSTTRLRAPTAPTSLSSTRLHAFDVCPGVVCFHAWLESPGRRRLPERSQFLPCGISTTGIGCPNGIFQGSTGKSCYPFPDFGGGSYQATYGQSQYNGLQTKLEQQFSNGLTYLLTYTWSKTHLQCRRLAQRRQHGQSAGLCGSRPGSQVRYCSCRLRHSPGSSTSAAATSSHSARIKRFMNHGGAANAVLGGWAVNWIATLQGGQPINFGCDTAQPPGSGCNDILLSGQSPQLGIKIMTAGGYHGPYWIGNPGAISQPCQLGGTPGQTLSPIPDSPAGCIALTGAAASGR